MKRKNVLFMALIAVSSIVAAFLPVSTYQTSFNPSITEEEKQALIFMREEEKLARDVYLKMQEKYNARVFSNIYEAEYRHMTFVKDLLDTFKVDDPVKSNERGGFTNSELSSAYFRLIEQGNISLIEALKAGAEIEDMDIADLNKRIPLITNNAILKTFEYLKQGSENHLRAFMRNLQRRGGTYEPKYLSKTEFDEILKSE
jgi:hypothetical protein